MFVRTFLSIGFFNATLPVFVIASIGLSDFDVAAQAEETKLVIQRCHSQLAGPCTQEQRFDLSLRLAMALYKDQEKERAFTVFLQCLEEAEPSSTAYVMSDHEASLYERLHADYLSHSGPSAQEKAQEMVNRYASVVAEHKDYADLSLLIAVAYANLGEFEHFFPLFMRAYQQNPKHYLVAKTKALLHVRLWRRGRTPAEKEERRLEVAKNMAVAVHRFPTDPSLYRLWVSFASEEDKGGILASSLNNIVSHNMILGRDDTAFLAREAVDMGRFQEARKLISLGRRWYRRSQALDRAEQYLETEVRAKTQSQGA